MYGTIAKPFTTESPSGELIVQGVQTLTDCNSPEGDFAVKGFAIVPYIQGIAEPIRRVLNNCGIKVALKPFQTLGHIFAKPNDRVPTDRKTHAVQGRR